MAQRDSLNGTWMLDKSRGKWSMRGYLETLHVNELVIQAHEKGETETDTYHTITLDTTKNTVRIVKVRNSFEKLFNVDYKLTRRAAK